jgi:hypothetical protein
MFMKANLTLLTLVARAGPILRARCRPDRTEWLADHRGQPTRSLCVNSAIETGRDADSGV